MALPDNYKNFVRVTVPQGYDSIDTSVELSPEDIARLPAAPFDLTWFDVTNYPDPSLDPNREIVRVTAAPVGTVISFARAQQGTAATDKNTTGATYAMLAGFNEKFVADLNAALGTIATGDAALDARLDTVEGAVVTLTATDTALDARMDANDTAIADLTAADVAFDTRIDELEASALSIGDIYLAAQHGILPGNADNTAALQTLINSIGALARNATIVFEEIGPYIFAGALQDTGRSNCIIKYPAVSINARQYSITLKGGQGRVTFSPSSTVSVPLPAGTQFKCTTNAGAGGAFIGGIGTVGDNLNDNTFVCARFEDIIFLMPPNPVLTCINLDWFTNTAFKDCSVIAGTSQSVFDTTEPTTPTSYGVKQPRVNSGINQRVEGVLNILGFYNGMRVGEGAMINDLGIFSCKNGVVYDFSNGVSQVQRLIVGWSVTSIQINAQHPMMIGEYSCERWNAPAWYTFVRDLNDPGNVGVGELRFHTVVAGAAWAPGVFTMNGGANMYIREMGVAPPSLPPSPTISAANVGIVNASTVAVTFTDEIKAPSYSTGVTIKVNGTPATISGATRQPDNKTVYYVLSAAVLSVDVLLYSYVAANGFIQSVEGGHLADVTDFAVSNVSGGVPLAYDTFTDADGTLLTAHTMDIGTGWLKREGAANDSTIQSNHVQSTQDAGAAYCYVTNLGTPNCKINAEIMFSAFGTASPIYYEIIVRELSVGERIRLIMTESGAFEITALPRTTANVKMQFVTESGGSTFPLDSMIVSLNSGAMYSVEAILDGDDLSFEVDGHVVTITQPFNNTATNVGFRFFQPSPGALILDNFIVNSL